MKSGRDAGFTLPEAMIAGTLSILLALPSFRLLQSAYGVATALYNVSRTNAAARQTFALLADGTSVSSNVEVAQSASSASARGFSIVEGLRSQSTVPAANTLRSSNQLSIADGTLLALGDTLSPVSITCRGPGLPIPDCISQETLTVAGWIAADPTIIAPSTQIGAGSTASLSITITNPFEAQRTTGSAMATQRYRMMFNLNPESRW